MEGDRESGEGPFPKLNYYSMNKYIRGLSLSHSQSVRQMDFHAPSIQDTNEMETPFFQRDPE